MMAPSKEWIDSVCSEKFTCLLHVLVTEASKVMPFTAVNCNKVCKCAERWKNLGDGIEKQISVEH